MRLADIDRSATATPGGWLHRTPVAIKLLGLAAVITGAIISWNPWVLAGLSALVLGLGLSARLRPRLLISLAAYPLIFSILLAISLRPGWTLTAVLLLKTFSTALAAVSLVLSTPYPRIFALTGRILPQLLNDSLLMAYRSLFILGELLGNLLTALRLRGGLSWRHPLALMRNLGGLFGALMVMALDLAEHDYEVLGLRGYDGDLRIDTKGNA
ncbi:MAG: energy-coupling factor transporter transmembrane protein EcfT [Coriobacteriia bacterium]|nr:energy-coupling factor transporter transmembrane protein EcfT [Coriobacteriia bacterium]